MKQVTFLIGGDLAPTKSNYLFFADGNIEALLEAKLIDLLQSVDYRIFNLEVPLTDNLIPIIKDGPTLSAPASAINGIKSLDPSVLALANNHILDQDEQGLFRTIELLDKHGIKYVGAGNDLENASKPLVIEKDGLKVGIYACAENEFSIAETNRAGANPLDPLESLDHIMRLKAKSDFVIVLHHGGKEHYRYPSPGLQKVCRKIVEKGADLVICQHSHCIGAFENFNGSVIVYGQGNFIFDRNDNEFWKTGLLIKASFSNKMFVEFIPVQKKGNGVGMPDTIVSNNIIGSFHARSKQITEHGFVEAQYEKLSSEEAQYYMAVFAGFGEIVRNIDKLFNGLITRTIFPRKKITRIQNHIECESHRELILNYIRQRRIRKHV
jgi:poly-gamma-glutamate capsule biosynthesis protein CapA/YwtB (metallophosphatase superfamily)